MQGENTTGCSLRSQDGNVYSLPSNTPVGISENCTVKLVGSIDGSTDFKLCFDTPEDVDTTITTPLGDDEFHDSIVTPNSTERTIDQLLEEEFLINPEFLGNPPERPLGLE